MHRLTFLSVMITFLLSSAGCGDDSSSQATTISISSSGMFDDEILLRKGVDELITIVAKDAAGTKLTLSGDVSWTSSAPDIIDIRDMGSTGLAKGAADWFDVTDIAEDVDPKATLTATYQGLTASIDAFVILDAEGIWTVTIGSDNPTDVPFLQEGRVIYQPLAGMEGELYGATLNVDTADIALTGIFSSRDEISGTGVDADGNTKSWSATR